MKKLFLILSILIFLSFNYANADHLIYSCTLQGKEESGENYYYLNTDKKKIYWSHNISYGNRKNYEIILVTDTFNDEIARGYMTQDMFMAKDNPGDYKKYIEPFIKKNWKKLEQTKGRPYTKKEKLVLDYIIDKFNEVKFYMQINFITNEFITSTPPIYMDDIPKDLPKDPPIDLRMLNPDIGKGSCVLKGKFTE